MKIQDFNLIEKISSKIILIKLIDVKGSSPREKDTNMCIYKNGQFGTIGGGELEYRTIKEAKKMLSEKNEINKILEFPLGPSLGQCCGGYVKVKLIKFSNGKQLMNKNKLKEELIENNKNLYIFGAGHISKAIIEKLDGTGFNVFVIDSRQKIISEINYNFVTSILAKEPKLIIKNIPSESYCLIMTHSHKIDLSICYSLLKMKDFSYIGLIGSKTKKIRFTKKLQEMGLNKNLINKIECPIGITGIKGKEPDIIAISIIARLLEFKSSLENKYKHLRLIKGSKNG